MTRDEPNSRKLTVWLPQYYAMDDFRVRMPDIVVQTIGDVIQGKPFTCNVFFINPLPKSLTKGIKLYWTIVQIQPINKCNININ